MSRASYHPVQVGLHWLVFLIIVVSLASVQLHEEMPKGSDIRATFMKIHMLMGQLIFLSVVIRIVVRALMKDPDPIDMPQWQVLTSKLVHIALYAWMILLPMTGVLFVQAGGREIHFMTFTLPQLLEPNPELKATLKGIHEFLGESIYYLIGLHAAAALWHHYIQKDGILKRMSFRK